MRGQRLPEVTFIKRVVCEGLGTLLLVATVVGSGVMGQRLCQGNLAVALLANTLATGAGLAVLIAVFGPVSGAHFNPVVTAVEIAFNRQTPRDGAAYIGAQLAGGLLGTMLAHAMFALPLWQPSLRVRTGGPQWLSEAVATFGLLLVIAAVSRHRPGAAPLAVGGFITAAYWFTASTSFANPAVTLARAFTDTFAGIAPSSVPGFVAAQAAGGAVGALVGRWLFAPEKPRA